MNATVRKLGEILFEILKSFSSFRIRISGKAYLRDHDKLLSWNFKFFFSGKNIFFISLEKYSSKAWVASLWKLEFIFLGILNSWILDKVPFRKLGKLISRSLCSFFKNQLKLLSGILGSLSLKIFHSRNLKSFFIEVDNSFSPEPRKAYL